MVTVSSIIIIIIIILDILNKIYLMEKENIFFNNNFIIKANGYTIKWMDMEFFEIKNFN